MEIKHLKHESKGVFAAYVDKKPAGCMTYTWAGPTRLIIDHTETDPAFAGRGIGKAMVMEAVKFARENKYSILPLCPFAKGVFEKTAEIQDVLD